MSTTRTFRTQLAQKLAEHGRLRRGLMFLAAGGAAMTGVLGVCFAGNDPVNNPTPAWAVASQIFGLLVSGGVGLVFAFFEDNSADIARTAQTLEEERDTALRDAAQREALLLKEIDQEKRELAALKEEYKYALELYQFSRGIGESSDPMLQAGAAERAQMLHNTVRHLLEFIVEAKGALLNVGEERWTFGIYVWNSSSEQLEMLACRRWSKIEEDREHRTWSRGEGHVGLAFAQKREQVCGDSNDPNIKDLITANGEKWRQYDAEQYVSFASVPIQLGAAVEPLGVLVATSNVRGRFLPEAKALEDGRRDTVEALRAMADTLATLLALQHLSKGDDEDE